VKGKNLANFSASFAPFIKFLVKSFFSNEYTLLLFDRTLKPSPEVKKAFGRGVVRPPNCSGHKGI